MGPENRVSSKYRVSSESSVFTSHFPKMDEQEEYLLEKRSEKDSEVSMNRQELRYRPRSSYLIALLMLSNLVVLLAILLTLVLHDNKSKKIDRNQSSNPSWFPPERFHKKIFDYEPIYATENAEEAQKAWTNLIPVGKGFVVVRNDTKLPDMPQLDQSLPEQHAMVSVFHQLHCLFVAREAYFSPAEVDLNHLYHCWDYLRQGIMCSGDTSLEWVPAPPGDIGSTGWGYEHVCRDYGEIFDWAERNKLTDHKKIH